MDRLWKYRTALVINGLVTLIATYHYFRIFDSWNAAYSVGKVAAAGDVAAHYAVTETGKPFNDAYRFLLAYPGHPCRGKGRSNNES